jgi:cholesterol oxidase
MQSSDNFLYIRYKKPWWRLGGWEMNSELPAGEKRIPSYIPVANEVTRRMAKKIKGYPKGSWFEVLMDAPTTAHILGGCVMADNPEEGVVDKAGRLFGYPNLYVADGSVVPVNLNVNPALTITALAEYILSQIPGR